MLDMLDVRQNVANSNSVTLMVKGGQSVQRNGGQSGVLDEILLKT